MFILTKGRKRRELADNMIENKVNEEEDESDDDNVDNDKPPFTCLFWH